MVNIRFWSQINFGTILWCRMVPFFGAKGYHSLIPVEYGKTFNTLFEKRHSSDYEAFAYCDQALVNDLTPLAQAFIGKIKELLED